MERLARQVRGGSLGGACGAVSARRRRLTTGLIQVSEARRALSKADEDWKKAVDAVKDLADAFEALGRGESVKDAARLLLPIAVRRRTDKRASVLSSDLTAFAFPVDSRRSGSRSTAAGPRPCATRARA